MINHYSYFLSKFNGPPTMNLDGILSSPSIYGRDPLIKLLILSRTSSFLIFLSTMTLPDPSHQEGG